MKALALLCLVSFSALAADAPKVVVMVPGDVVTEPGAFTPEALYIQQQKTCADNAETVRKIDENPPIKPAPVIISGVVGVAIGAVIAALIVGAVKK